MAQVGHGDGQKILITTGEDGSYHTAQVGPGDRGRQNSKKRNGFDFDLIRIGLDFLKTKKIQAMNSLFL